MRLDKLLSHCGYGSRNDVKKLIKSGAVSVNEDVKVTANQKVDPSVDTITVFDEAIFYEEMIYLMMNKPDGVITATEDKTQTTVLDLVEPLYKERKVAPVGRLDKDTTGLLLLTNDGKLTHQLLSPKSKVGKVYEVLAVSPVTEEMISQLEAGVVIDEDYLTMPAHVEQTDEVKLIYLTIYEGKYHQVKRMMRAVGNKVDRLKRVEMGPLVLDDMLAVGEYRYLTEEEIIALGDKK